MFVCTCKYMPTHIYICVYVYIHIHIYEYACMYSSHTVLRRITIAEPAGSESLAFLCYNTRVVVLQHTPY